MRNFKQWRSHVGVDVEVAAISKTFDATTALTDVSVTVPAGQTLVLLGPSGCGKTTLLRCLAGLEQPDTGCITVGGTTVFDHNTRTSQSPRQRGFGMVFQDWALFPHMSVADNIGYGMTPHQRQRGEVEELMQMVDLDGTASRLPNQLSGGQQQRVALARALARKPPLLLFDEPFSNLDAELRRQLRSEVAALLKSLNVSAVFVTHDQEEAFVLADEVALMKAGRVVQQCSPRDLYSDPATTWAATFVGDANLLSGAAAGNDAATAVGPVPLLVTPPPSGGQLRVLARPEALSMKQGGTAKVSAVEYYGHDAMHTVELRDGEVVRVRTHPFDMLEAGTLVDVSYQGPPTKTWPAS